MFNLTLHTNLPLAFYIYTICTQPDLHIAKHTLYFFTISLIYLFLLRYDLIVVNEFKGQSVLMDVFIMDNTVYYIAIAIILSCYIVIILIRLESLWNNFYFQLLHCILIYHGVNLTLVCFILNPPIVFVSLCVGFWGRSLWNGTTIMLRVVLRDLAAPKSSRPSTGNTSSKEERYLSYQVPSAQMDILYGMQCLCNYKIVCYSISADM